MDEHLTPAAGAPARPRPSASRLLWIPRLLAALILGQTLFFKFSGAAESVAIFEALGAEPWGRWASGILELVAVILLVAPLGARGLALGGLLVLGLMGGAIGSHLTVLGVEVGGDGGLLFALAVTTFLCGAWVLAAQLRGARR